MAAAAAITMDIDAPILWTSRWEIGIPLIDSQHRRLVEMAENLRQTVLMEQTNTTKITKVLKGLITYCADHFECEQMLMQMIGYPTYDAHLAKHRRFTAQTLQWFEDFQTGQLDPKVVMYALMEWLIDHILHNDITIFQCCQAKGLDPMQFQTVSDVIPKEQPKSIWNLPLEYGVLIFLLPALGFYCFIAFWQSSSSYLISGLVLAAQAILYAGAVLYLRRSMQLRTQQLHLHSARQLADNLLAGEIAGRIATMNLDDIDALMAGESSPLVLALQEIVESVRMYLPYIPETILAVVRGEEEENSDDGGKGCQPEAFPSQAYSAASARGPAVLGSARGVGLAHMAPYSSDSNLPPHVPPSASNISTLYTEENLGRFSMDQNFRQSNEQLAHLNKHQPPSPNGMTEGNAAKGLFFKKARSAGSMDGSGVVYSPSHKAHQLPQHPPPPPPATGAPLSHRSRGSVCSAAHSATGHTQSNLHSATAAPAVKAKALSTLWLTKKSISLLVADISGFHDLANTLQSTDELLHLHSTYVSALEAIGKATKGKFNGIIGDRITVSWNAANSVGNYAQQACKAALKLKETFSHQPKESVALQVKIGVGTGNALVGNMGSKSTLSFSIVGPVSIITFALCKLNGFLQTDILICSNTWRNAKEFFIAKIAAQYDIACAASPLLGAEPSQVDSNRLVLEDEDEHITVEVLTPVTAASGIGAVAGNIMMPTSTSVNSVRWISQSESFVELRKLYALQLLSAQGHNEGDEWMYVLQNAVNPFEAYNDALLQLYYGSFTKGHAALKKYVELFPQDKSAKELLDRCEAHHNHGSNGPHRKEPMIKWTYGWHPSA